MKTKRGIFLLLVCLVSQAGLRAQRDNKFGFTQQISSVVQYGYADDHMFGANARYIPQISLESRMADKGLFDLEVSGNFYGFTGTQGQGWEWDGKITPYRAWLRYSNDQMELRLGLQKINFGSALLLRPLMWFDSLDPRDPLQLTDGVWAGLFRYYFPNNANLWVWALTGNDEPKGWELAPNTKTFSPEFGGRFQMPVPSGETALTVHYRQSVSAPIMSADEKEMVGTVETGEFRVGLDAKIDLGVGLCLESTYQRMFKDAGMLNNQLAVNLGLDYTFGVGNGLGLNIEHLVSVMGERGLSKEYCANTTALMMTYPVGLSDMLSLICMYAWKENQCYSFLGWKRDFDHVSINLNAYWNPQHGEAFHQYTGRYMDGVGLQFIFQWNHNLEKLWQHK